MRRASGTRHNDRDLSLRSCVPHLPCFPPCHWLFEMESIPSAGYFPFINIILSFHLFLISISRMMMFYSSRSTIHSSSSNASGGVIESNRHDWEKVKLSGKKVRPNVISSSLETLTRFMRSQTWVRKIGKYRIQWPWTTLTDVMVHPATVTNSRASASQCGWKCLAVSHLLTGNLPIRQIHFLCSRRREPP